MPSVIDRLNIFKNIDTSTTTFYNLIEQDLSTLILVNSLSADLEIRLPSGFQPGWWCNIMKENNANSITFTSTLPIKSKGYILTDARTPVHVTYTPQNYWIIVGELLSL